MLTAVKEESLPAGLLGPVIVLVLNFVGLWLLDQPAARFLTMAAIGVWLVWRELRKHENLQGKPTP